MKVVAAETKPVPVPGPKWDGGLAARTIVGDARPANLLLKVIAERIRVAADHLRIPRDELFGIFEPHTVFEGETAPAANGQGFLIVETHHVMEGMVGKGALKIVFPHDLLAAGAPFQSAGHGSVEVLPPDGERAWPEEAEAEEVVRETMRELMTGESLSMSLKCQATAAPFAGSEGLVLCAQRVFDAGSGRYFLRPALKGREEHAAEDKELIESMMNSTAEVLTRAQRIAYDRIVHAAETNSTLTARLSLQLPTNVVEGHLRALLQSDPQIIIGDEDMTPRLRELLSSPDYRPTRCALAKAAAAMQMDHALLLPGSRQKLRELLAELPARGWPAPAQYRALINVFFGSGEVQQQEDRLFHHRERILRALGVALSAQCLEDCGDPEVLTLYLKTLLDNQRVMLQALLLARVPPGESLPVDWFERCAPLSRAAEKRLEELSPSGPLDKEHLARRFLSIVEVLFGALSAAPEQPEHPYQAARRELLQLAIRAITSAGEVLPPVERIVFFTLPYIYDCATPKLGVVTRKPADVCGSELRPQAMAAGALISIEILLKKLTRKPDPFAGLKIAIEGLGNAGKNLARLLADHGAKVVAVSDSKGAAIREGGFGSEELRSILAHKDAGKHLDTFRWPARHHTGLGPAPAGGEPPRNIEFYHDPAVLKQADVDVLVLTAVAGSVDEQTAADIRARVVCELTGAAVTGPAKQVLKERHIEIIPDNLASSGGMLVSLSEMLQNSTAQIWDRQLEEQNLYQQLARSYDEVIRLAGHYNVDIPTATDMLALRRMQQLTQYRQELKEEAAALASRIRRVAHGERVLVVFDDDEDGVASAAILRRLVLHLNPAAAEQITFLSESFRSEAIIKFLREQSAAGHPVRHVFALDRSYPLTSQGQHVLAAVAAQCRVTFVNNHDLPPELASLRQPTEVGRAEQGLKQPSDLGILLISPQTLRATVPARQFPTAMILKDLAHVLCQDPHVRAQIDWQAAVGSCLDIPDLSASPWLLFYGQFIPEKILDAAHAVRTVARAGGFLGAIDALAGVTRPDQLETNAAWGRFLAAYKRMDERVQVLVEKIILENRRKPLTIHFFTDDEVAWPRELAGNPRDELDLYHWISERLTRHGDLADKPIIVGQVVRRSTEAACLGVRIRSPRGVDLAQAGLPTGFESGGLPNTAVAKLPLADGVAPQQIFEQLVDRIWAKTTGPFGPRLPADSVGM